MKKFISLMLTASIFMLSLSGCGPAPEVAEPQDEPTEQEETTDESQTAQADSFAVWQDNTVSFTPQVEDYSIDSDLENVERTDILMIPESGNEYLAKNGFVVTDGWYDEYFSIYEDNRYEYIPSFVTTDSVLHTYHLYFNFLLKSLEEEELYNLAYDLSKEMQELSLSQYEKLKGTDWENAARRNVAYFSVVMKVLDEKNAKIPEFVADTVADDIELMEAHEGMGPSNVMGEPLYLEDFSQYIPRGHYTKSEQLSRYFKALMYYGRMTFRLQYEDETRSALLMVEALKNDDSARNDWRRLYEPIGFFVGEPDDLVYLDYAPVAEKAYGEGFNVDTLLSNKDALKSFMEEAGELRDPGVNSMPVLGTILAPGGVEERTEEIKGFRFMGQRFTIDAYVFQKLICREVGNLDGTMDCPKEDSRMLPNGLDIPAAMGSKIAYEILDEMGETGYKMYPENMKKLQDGMSKLPMSQWTTNLYWGWMHTLNALLPEYGEGYPMFMQSDEWKKKELNTYLGSWSELKHDTILYAKQVYAELGGGPMIEEKDDRGYVEPNPEVYARLASLTQLTADGLKDREILSVKNEEQLLKLKEMLLKLRDISVKELENTALTDDEYEFIRAYGGSLEHFWYETFTDLEKEKGNLLNDNPAPIIADVATNPNCCVLEVGTGYIEPIYVVFPIDGELHVGRGGVYSYYEFVWPMADRLTDEKWRDEILWGGEEKPDRPAWQTFLKVWE